MNTQNPTAEYLLLIRGTDWDTRLSPEEIQEVMNQFVSWHDGLKQRNIVKAAQPLVNEGKIVSGKGGNSVADGPFAEAKEAVGGYFLLQVSGQDEAVAIAKECPILSLGATIEVRQIAEICSVLERMNVQLSQALSI
ncbi:MAG: hypothetical protein JOY96_10325 [Verrucomicrobia bacterium]|nr:hypothetical protein [Verrucomicrobiota bacterium]MBV9674595.1 hypothetical protein [Verrucomicrobiota bacterium]